jgi:hypothetical protein
MPRVPASLRSLLHHLIDYAGLYPPASLPLEIVIERYRGFRASPESWILNRLVLPAAKLADASLDPAAPVTLLVDDDPGPLPPQVETLETKLPELASTLPVYHEAPLADIGGGLAKIRTGGLTPDAIPPSTEIARFLCDAAARRIAFKATAGLHHPIRSVRALTYAAESPRAPMHGFLNLFTAAAMAWHSVAPARIPEVLDETDIARFEFHDDAILWRGIRISTQQIETARRDFAHSFGSCSFEEPVSELREAGLLP